MSAATFQPIPDFYTWGFTGAPIQIVLNIDVVRRLRKQIQDSEKASGELSWCGLLIGDASKPGVTRILDFESLQTLDAGSVEAATGSGSADVVGFYRTTPIGSTSMPDEDKALAASLFGHPNSAFLLIEAGKSGIGEARFCFWGERELFDWPMMLFPFDAEELASKEWRRRPSIARGPSQSSYADLAEVMSSADKSVGASPEVGHGTVSAEPETQPVSAPKPFPASLAAHRRKSTTPEPVAKRRQGTGWRRLALALVTLVTAAVLVGAFVYFRRGANPPVASQAAADRAGVKPPLGLTVEKRGSRLLVSWNGNAPVISKANFGMLLIRGTAVSRDVPLTTDELRAGSVVYAAPADQVRFQLNVVAGEQVARESLIFVQPRIAGRRASLTSSQSGAPGVSSVPGSPRELRQFKPMENRDPATATPQHIEEPPPVIGAAKVNYGTPSLLNQQPVTLPAPVDSPARSIPQGEPPELSVEAHPPVATHRVVPNVPALLKGVFWKSAEVDVTVSVDASGRVVNAEAVAKPGVHPLLVDAAVQAARRWQFQPAQFNGHPVSANAVLRFNFDASR